MSLTDTGAMGGANGTAHVPDELGEAADADQYLTFQLSGEAFAVSVQQVREVLDLQRITRLADGPSMLVGIIDVRGAGIPVIDLRGRLGLDLVGTTEHTRLLVLEVGDGERQLVVAAQADAVNEVTHFSPDQVEAPPRCGQPWDCAFIRGLSRRDGAFVTLLDLEKLFGGAALDLHRASY